MGNRWLRAVLTDSPDQLSLLQAFKVKTPDELADGRHKRRLARIRRLCLGNAKLAEALVSFFTWLTMLPDLVCMILEHLEPIGGITLNSARFALQDARLLDELVKRASVARNSSSHREQLVGTFDLEAILHGLLEAFPLARQPEGALMAQHVRSVYDSTFRRSRSELYVRTKVSFAAASHVTDSSVWRSDAALSRATATATARSAFERCGRTV